MARRGRLTKENEKESTGKEFKLGYIFESGAVNEE
jgi:hypothetical protein